MLQPLEQFVCDYCGGIIEKPEEGWVEWLGDFTDEGLATYGYRIIHHAAYSPRKPGDCYHYTNDPRRLDMYLTSFLGGEGMAKLLSQLDVGPYHEPTYRGTSVADLREYVEFMRRLTIPFYEEARLYWDRADIDGFFEGANEIWLYLPENLRVLIERYKDRD